MAHIGDMLQRLTNYGGPPTTHRVVKPPGGDARKSRYSVSFFRYTTPDALIDERPACIDAGHPNRYPEAITAQAYLP